VKLSDYIQHLPKRAHCTDQIGARQLELPAVEAVSYRHIQPNESWKTEWLVYDIDQKGAWFCSERAGVPTPTCIAINPANSHAHVAYQLETPVIHTQKSRQLPQDYLEAIDRGLRSRLGADPAYSGFLTKNPVHPHWITDWCSTRTYLRVCCRD